MSGRNGFVEERNWQDVFYFSGNQIDMRYDHGIALGNFVASSRRSIHIARWAKPVAIGYAEAPSLFNVGVILEGYRDCRSSSSSLFQSDLTAHSNRHLVLSRGVLISRCIIQVLGE
jgi:hypothetical protein